MLIIIFFNLNIITVYNYYTIMCLNSLKERIENMDKNHQVEILRILNKFNNFKTNENKNGTFINLTELSDDIISELQKYVNYVEEQQKQLKIGENEKEIIEKHFFANSN
jgi:hypothetical protein